MSASHLQKHDAGRHLAVAHALLQGRAARVVGPHRHVEIDGEMLVVMVATMGAWQIADVDEFTASSATRYALVDFTGGATDLYYVPGNDLRQGVRERHDAFLVHVGGQRPRNPDSKHTKIAPADIVRWKSRWPTQDTSSSSS